MTIRTKGLFFSARPAGLEPATISLEGSGLLQRSRALEYAFPLSFLFALSACVIPWDPEGNAPPERVAAALERWTDRGLPAGDCADEVISIYTGVTPSELHTECGLDETPAACTTYREDESGTRAWSLLIGRDRPLEILVEHELRHVLASCSGLHADADKDHLDPAVWFAPIGDPDRWEYEAYRP